MTVFLRKNNQKPKHNCHKLSLLQRFLEQQERYEEHLQFIPGRDYANYMDKVYSLSVFIRVIRA